MAHRVAQRTRHVVLDQFQPLGQTLLHPTLGHLLDHQPADHALGTFDLTRPSSVLGQVEQRVGLEQRHDLHHPRPALLDVLGQWLLDLGRKLIELAGVDQRFASRQHLAGQLPHRTNQVRLLVDSRLAADRENVGPWSHLHRDAQPVAAQQQPGIVGTRRGHLVRIQAAMQFQDEVLE